MEIRVFELCWKEVIFALIQHQSTEYIFIFDSLLHLEIAYNSAIAYMGTSLIYGIFLMTC